MKKALLFISLILLPDGLRGEEKNATDWKSVDFVGKVRMVKVQSRPVYLALDLLVANSAESYGRALFHPSASTLTEGEELWICIWMEKRTSTELAWQSDLQFPVDKWVLMRADSSSANKFVSPISHRILSLKEFGEELKKEGVNLSQGQ